MPSKIVCEVHKYQHDDHVHMFHVLCYVTVHVETYKIDYGWTGITGHHCAMCIVDMCIISTM